MKCIRCEKEFQGNFCPNCGLKVNCIPVVKNTKPAKNKNVGATVLIIFIICIFAFCAVMGILFGEEGNTNDNNSFSSKETSSVEKIEYIKVTVDKLYNDFDANEVAANKKYRGNYVKVTGIVTEISDGGLLTSACILLNVEDTVVFGDVQCNFSSKNAEQIAKISKGQKITVAGICSGRGTINIDIDNCEIVSD